MIVNYYSAGIFFLRVTLLQYRLKVISLQTTSVHIYIFGLNCTFEQQVFCPSSQYAN